MFVLYDMMIMVLSACLVVRYTDTHRCTYYMYMCCCEEKVTCVWSEYCGIVEAVRRLKIQTREKQDGDASLSYPDRPGEPDCTFYMKTGTCRYGANCRFNHPSMLAAEVNYELPQSGWY